MHTFRGSSLYKFGKQNSIMFNYWNALSVCHQSPKRGRLKVHLGPMWVLLDWWPIIRDLSLCWEFCSERHSKRQYERWNKILYGQQWRKREKSWRFRRIEDLYLIWVIGAPYYQGGYIGWVGEVQNIKIYPTSKNCYQARHIRPLARFQRL
jgi:hypothetical protein